MIIETLLIGLVLALLWTELTDVSPGGIIVPAYFALHLAQPLRGIATLAAALLSLLLFKILSRHLILFGRRRFVLLVLMGALFSQTWFLLAPQLFPDSVEIRVIGWVIPGILANNLHRQRFFPTVASLVTVATLTFAIVRLVSWL